MIDVRVPGDKSITHRSLMLAALAEGTSVIRGALVSADTQSTAAALRAFGVTIPELQVDAELVIEGNGPKALRQPDTVIDCGNSGTSARLLMGVAAGLPMASTFDGDRSLRRRPMRRVYEPLQQMGARAIELGEPGCLPLRIEGGALRPLYYESKHASAQIKSALMLAGITGGAHVVVVEPLQSRDHTERMLRAAGVAVETKAYPDGRYEVRTQPLDRLRPTSLKIPGDFSSAAFLVAAALLGVIDRVRVRNVGVNPTRTGLLDVLRGMGAAVDVTGEREEGGEPTADLVVHAGELRGVTVDPLLIPRMIDEVPVLAILAARAQGETRITEATELRVKESDRIRMMVENLNAIGVSAKELPDGMVIKGTDRPLRGQVLTAMDHRIAMAFGILARQPRNKIELDDPDIVAVSFPEFWRVLTSVGRS
jgi:3-phosphoshikimate 1-carboxyvinyltransferase